MICLEVVFGLGGGVFKYVLSAEGVGEMTYLGKNLIWERGGRKLRYSSKHWAPSTNFWCVYRFYERYCSPHWKMLVRYHKKFENSCFSWYSWTCSAPRFPWDNIIDFVVWGNFISACIWNVCSNGLNLTYEQSKVECLFVNI